MHFRTAYREPSPLTEAVCRIRARFSPRELLRLRQLGGQLTDQEEDRVRAHMKAQGERAAALEKVAEREAVLGTAA